MDKTVETAKVAITAFFSTLGAILGWKGIMAVVWVALMIVDYITGTLSARKNGKWSSGVAKEGIWHKVGCVVIVVVAFVSDFIMGLMITNIPILNISWPDLFAPVILAWYLITELGSILENAVSMGAPVPKWIVKIFDATLKMVDKAGEGMGKSIE